MQLYSENEQYKLYQGDMLDMLEIIESNTIDSIITDPPYELNFMGKRWDNSGIAFQIDTWKKCYEVLKSGGYLIVFGGSRTFHKVACAIEDAGFEIRDTIMWLYGSGFPKSQNIGKMYDKKMKNDREKIGETRIGKTSLGDNSGWDTSQHMKDIKATGKVDITKGNSKWEGWGSCLKPSFEPIIVARKPFKGTLVDNIIENGVGGINIDECRVPFEKTTNPATNPLYRKNGGYKLPAKGQLSNGAVSFSSSKNDVNEIGRFPANTILTYDERDYDEVCGNFPISKGACSQNNYSNGSIYRGQSLNTSATKLNGFREWYNDNGSACRYFYNAKATKKDRDEGLEEFEETIGHSKGNGLDRICEYCGVSQLTPELCHCEKKSWVAKPKKNSHPTVKPTTLMQYLVRLVTPNNGTILDPFNGSGSTGKAVMYENKERDKNYKYIGIELNEDYLSISKARIEYVNKSTITDEDENQLSLF